MQTIKVKDITQSHRAISAIDGNAVYTRILESFEESKPVVVDFEGIDLTITAFLNASIGKLYSQYSSEQIRELLDIENLPAEEIQLLKLVIDQAKERFGKGHPNDLDSIDIVNED